MILIIVLVISLVCFAITGISYLATLNIDCGRASIISIVIAAFDAVIIVLCCTSLSCDDYFKEKYNNTKFCIENGYCTNETIRNVLDVNNRINRAKQFVNSELVGAFVDKELLNYQPLEITVKITDLVESVGDLTINNLMN